MRLAFTIAILLICTACTTEQAYRLPFADGVEVRITADPDTHVTPVADMYDMQAVQRNQIVAAAAAGLRSVKAGETLQRRVLSDRNSLMIERIYRGVASDQLGKLT